MSAVSSWRLGPDVTSGAGGICGSRFRNESGRGPSWPSREERSRSRSLQGLLSASSQATGACDGPVVFGGWQFLPFRKRVVGMGKPRKCAVVWTGSSGGVACTAPGVECRTPERGGKDLISGPETPPQRTIKQFEEAETTSKPPRAPDPRDQVGMDVLRPGLYTVLKIDSVGPASGGRQTVRLTVTLSG